MASEQKVIKAPPDPREPYRRRLIDLVMSTGLTQTELASRTTLTEAYLSLLCNYKRYPSLYALISLLKECGYELKIEQLPSEDSHGSGTGPAVT